jgi:hypothetical protein
MPVQAAVDPHQILLAGYECEVGEEAIASGVFSPGHVIKKDANGQVLKHATANGGGQLWVAQEDRLQGRTINTAYAVGDRVRYHIPQPGDRLLCRVTALTAAIANNAPLTSDGAGGVKTGTLGTHEILGFALEAVDNSAGEADEFIRVEWSAK